MKNLELLVFGVVAVLSPTNSSAVGYLSFSLSAEQSKALEACPDRCRGLWSISHLEHEELDELKAHKAVLMADESAYAFMLCKLDSKEVFTHRNKAGKDIKAPGDIRPLEGIGGVGFVGFVNYCTKQFYALPD